MYSHITIQVLRIFAPLFLFLCKHSAVKAVDLDGRARCWLRYSRLDDARTAMWMFLGNKYSTAKLISKWTITTIHKCLSVFKIHSVLNLRRFPIDTLIVKETAVYKWQSEPFSTDHSHLNCSISTVSLMSTCSDVGFADVIWLIRFSNLRLDKLPPKSSVRTRTLKHILVADRSGDKLKKKQNMRHELIMNINNSITNIFLIKLKKHHFNNFTANKMIR